MSFVNLQMIWRSLHHVNAKEITHMMTMVLNSKQQRLSRSAEAANRARRRRRVASVASKTQIDHALEKNISDERSSVSRQQVSKHEASMQWSSRPTDARMSGSCELDVGRNGAVRTRLYAISHAELLIWLEVFE